MGKGSRIRAMHIGYAEWLKNCEQAGIKKGGRPMGCGKKKGGKRK